MAKRLKKDIPEEIPESPALQAEDAAMRPLSFSEFSGQEAAKANLEVYISSARKRSAALDHVLLSGPPGLGKTTLAAIIANELGVPMKSVIAPAIARAGDLAAVLASLEPRQVLFIDEIHRLDIEIEEMLYSAMEDFRLDLIIGDPSRPGSSTVMPIDLNPFTLIGATTRPGSISAPLSDRFGIQIVLEPYTIDELMQIVRRGAKMLDLGIDDAALRDLARCSRGTPRIAGRNLRRVRDFAIAADVTEVTVDLAWHAMGRLGIDKNGLNARDRRYLDCLTRRYGGGPVGLETLATALHESKDTVEMMIEPYLVQEGYIERTKRGRMLSKGREKEAGPQQELFASGAGCTAH